MDGGGRVQDPDRRVFVSNLPYDIDWQTLKSNFRRAGNVNYAHIMKDNQTGKSKGCGIVEFETAAEAETAIDMFESTEMGGRTIHVRKDIQDAGVRQNIAAKRAANDGGGNAPNKRSRVDYEGGYGGGMDGGYARPAPGFPGRGDADFAMGQNGAGARGAPNANAAALDGGLSMGMGMGLARRARAAAAAAGGAGAVAGGGMFGADMYGGMDAALAARGMGMAGVPGMAGLGAAGLMGAAGLAAGMASLEAMAAYAGYAGRAREMFEAPMGGFDGGFDPGMAAGFGGAGFGGFGGGRGMGGGEFGADIGRRVFVTNLNFQTTWQEVKDLFKTVGNVTYVQLIKDKDGKSRGCAVVELETPDDALRAINALSNTELGGRRITVREDQKDPPGGGAGGMHGPPGGMHGPPGGMHNGAMHGGGGGGGGGGQRQLPPTAVQLMVHGLPFSYDWLQVKEMMKAACTILRVDIKRDQTGRSRGWATLLVDGEANAQKVIDMFNNTPLHGRTIQVHRDKYQPGRGPQQGGGQGGQQGQAVGGQDVV